MTRLFVRPGSPAFVRKLGLVAVVFLLSTVLSVVALPGRAFAATASDNFNRANNSSLGSNWTTISGDSAPSISSNQAVGVGGNSGSAWNANSFGSDQYSQIQVPSTAINSGDWIGASARVQANGDEYVGIDYNNGGTYELMLFKRISGGWTEIDGGAHVLGGALSAGTNITLIASGSTISMMQDTTMIFNRTDATLTGGSPGLEFAGTSALDNWSGGDLYTVGGTISGLTGSVVLQDDAGDDLSVTANGSFTFPTALFPGLTYNATVKIDPDQQVCTVSSGSGTMSAANVTNISISCVANTNGSATDNFNRANGSVGANWLDLGGPAGLTISSNQAITGGGSSNHADQWAAQSFDSDQYSEVQLPNSTLTGGDWIGPTVRSQNSFSDLYVCFYFNNGGTYQVLMYSRVSGGWNQIGGYSSGQLSAGATIKLSAIGSTISCQVNGVEVMVATDTNLTGGAPGIWGFGASGVVDNWIGGDVVPPNTAPNTPTSLAQFKSDGTTSITTGAWTNQTTVVFSAAVTDPDAGDTDQICIEVLPVASSFTNTETSCGALVVTGNTATDTITGLTNGVSYKWQARTKDAGGLYSSWTSFNSGSTAFGIDTAAPTTGTVYDGSSAGVEGTYNSGSLTTLSCNWSGFSDAASGMASYDYSIGTTVGATDILGWTNVSSATTNVTVSTLTLHTSQTYFCNVRANDNAGNQSSAVSSPGQFVAPTLTFTISTTSVSLGSLNAGNSYTGSNAVTLTTSTNAYHGYTITASEVSPLTSGSHSIPDYTSPASAPTVWTGTGFGYNVSGGSAVSGFSGSKYAHFGTPASPDSPVVHGGTISGTAIANEQETVTLQAVASSTQPAGRYAAAIVFACQPSF